MRQQRLDSFRLYAIFFVIWAHIYFFSDIDLSPRLTKIIFNLLAVGLRCGIPFFFILSGYFTGGKIASNPTQAITIARAYTGRLFIIFLFWSFVYIVEQPQAFLTLLREQPVRVILEGSREHLWFLVSLILTVWLYALWPYRQNHKSFLFLGAILYGVGLLAGPYVTTPVGINLLFYNTRDGIFFSTLFFAIGVMFHNSKIPHLSWRSAAALTFGGMMLYCLEALFLRLVWQLKMTNHDYLLSSIPYGIAVFLFVMVQPETALDKFVGPYARYTLGIYAVHFLFLDLFNPLGSWINPYIWQFIYPILIFGFSLVTCIILSKTFLRKVVI